MNSIHKLFEQSAYEWYLSYNAAWLLFWLPILGSILIAFTALNRDIYRFILIEDGPVEWATFICFVAAMIVAIQVCNLFVQVNYKWQACFYAFFAIAMFFCAGEELSWGQRILNLPTPDALRIPGQQDELVFHNVGGTFGVFNIGIISVEFIGGIAYFVKRGLTVGQRGGQVNYLLPGLYLSSFFVIPLVYKLLQFVLNRTPDSVIGKYVEWTELCLALGLCLFVSLVLRQLHIETKIRRSYVTNQPIHPFNRTTQNEGD